MDTLSSRANSFLSSNPNSYGSIHVSMLGDVYDQDSNPNGAILMSIAENKLCNELFVNKMQQHAPITLSAMNYTNPTGAASLKAAMAQCLNSHVFCLDKDCTRQVKEEELIISTGCTGLLYQLSVLMFEQGDSILIPAPYYPAFDQDFGSLGGVHRIPVVPSDLDSYELTEESLTSAYNTGLSAGQPPKALLLTNPHNPVGKVYSASELRLAVDWCRQRRVHLICDEIYALSVFNTSVEGPFQSITSLLNNQLGDFVHVLWGVSKDLGASGLRVGVLYSQNQTLLAAVNGISPAFQVSNVIQEILAGVLADASFMTTLQKESNTKVMHSYQLLTSGLDRLQIPYRPVGAGIFVFIDLRGLLRQDSFEGERELHQALAREIKWSLTPGEACHHPVPGFFRACYCWVSAAAIEECLRRLEAFSATWRT